jgi:hypothetical protein
MKRSVDRARQRPALSPQAAGGGSYRLGHFSAAFTLDTYSDSILALQEGAAAAVAALVRKA